MIIRKSLKAQSGMEYLMTYGWAVLVVGIVVLLLMSLRVLDVDWWSVQNQVYGLSTFKISDFKATPHPANPTQRSVLIFQFINNRPTNVTISEMTFEGSDGNDYTLGQGDSPPIFVWYCPTIKTNECDAGNCCLNATQFPINMTAGQRFIINGTIQIPGEINTVFMTNVIIKYTSPRSDVNHSDTGKMRGRVETAS